MNGFVSIMQDVAKLVTGGSDLARAEARRIADERARRAAERMQGPALDPAPAIAFGRTGSPVERLTALRSATARVAELVANLRPRALSLLGNMSLRSRLR